MVKRQVVKRTAALFVDIDNVRPGFDLDMKALRRFVADEFGEIAKAVAYVRCDTQGRLGRLAQAAGESQYQLVRTSSNADGRMQFDLANLNVGAFRTIVLCSDDGGFADLLGYMFEQFRVQISLLYSGPQSPVELAKVSEKSKGKVLSMRDEKVRRAIGVRRGTPI